MKRRGRPRSAAPTIYETQTEVCATLVAERSRSTPDPVSPGCEVDSVRLVVHRPLNVAELAVEENEWSFQVAYLYAAIFRQKPKLTAPVMSYFANAAARTAQTPIPVDAAQRPGARDARLVVEGPAHEIVPALFKPSSSAFPDYGAPVEVQPFSREYAS